MKKTNKMEVQALANELFKRSSTEFDFTVELEIEGISIELLFDLDEDDFSIQINSNWGDVLYYYTEDVSDELTTSVLAGYIVKTHDKLEHIYFCDKMGKFLSREDNVELLKYTVFKKYAKKNEDCAVCLDETPTRTACNHSCCQRCLQKLTKCPICRKEFEI
jgi:hypothetical protein